MPLYEYDCPRCDRKFELLVRSDTVPACPSCGGQDLKKLLSTFAVSVAAGGGSRASLPASAAPCGSCGHPDGPGSCRYDA